MTVTREFARIPLDECHASAVRRISSLRRTDPGRAWEWESRECPRCYAKPGELCRMESGMVAWFHIARMFDPDDVDPRREAAALVAEWITGGAADGKWRQVYDPEVADAIAAEVLVLGARLGRPAPSLYRRRALGLTA